MGTLANSEEPYEMQHYAKVLLSECLANPHKKAKTGNATFADHRLTHGCTAKKRHWNTDQHRHVHKSKNIIESKAAISLFLRTYITVYRVQTWFSMH